MNDEKNKFRKSTLKYVAIILFLIVAVAAYAGVSRITLNSPVSFPVDI